MSVPRLAVESGGPQRLHPVPGPPQPGPPHPDIPVVERNESVYIWHDIDGREPYFDAPDVFAGFSDGSSAADYYPQQRLYRETLELHPQYVLENGVDFAHFKFVHQTPIVPVFTRHDFDEPVSYVDFTITFEGDENQTIDDVKSGVEAINGGPGYRGDEKLGDGGQPDHLCDHARRREHVRRPLHGLHRRSPGDDSPRAGQGPRIRRRDHPAVHPGHPHLVAPALFGSARAGGCRAAGFTAIRNWAKQFYPDGFGGSAAECDARYAQKGRTE